MNTQANNTVLALSTFEERYKFSSGLSLFQVSHSYQYLLGNFVLYAIGIQQTESVEFIRERLTGILTAWESRNGFATESTKYECIKDTVRALGACFDRKVAGSVFQVQAAFFLELSRSLKLERVFHERLHRELGLS